MNLDAKGNELGLKNGGLGIWHELKRGIEAGEGRCKRKGGSGMELNDAVLINESCGTPHVIAGHVGREMDQGNNDKKRPGDQSKTIADDSKLLP
ncbi:hypothetical protein V6N13_054308 [Hibiscus sabdariffa]|uniref:Uncharacterized protein n=1 Tax=Hibiscus sabdariffa TaxID=183260 RepID=A0ABR2DZU6_9ROSI